MPPLLPAIDDWLGYLGEIGFSDLYREGKGGSAAPPPPASEVPGSPPTPPSGPGDALAELARRAEGCQACALAAGRNRVVFGAGPATAELMFVGEGPGAEEDRRGLPFVGRAGELLTRIIEAIDLRRDEVYIANVVKCRPPGNREPETAEVAACIGFLERQIDLVRPRLLVALGRTAAQTLLGAGGTMAELRGTWYEVRGVPTRVTYHPAALLRNPGLKRPTWEDMQKVRDRLAAARSAKEGGS